MEKIHFKQAKVWLEGSKQLLKSEKEEEREKYAVAVSMVIHAIIKANDALTIKFMNITAKRHDDARRLFEDLLKKNFIKSEYSNYRQTIQEAINNKAKAEYRGVFFSKNDFETLYRKAEKFLKMVEETI